MALQRARVYEALRAKIFGAADWVKTYSAEPTDENEVPEGSVAVLNFGQAPEHEEGRRPLWTCTARVIIFARPGTGDGLVDQIEAALEAQPGEVQTFQQFSPWGPNTNLGGLCRKLQMGTVEVDLIRSGSDKRLELVWFDVTFMAV